MTTHRYPKPEVRRLRCWSCRHYRKNYCADNRREAYLRDAGNSCRGFDYEPGSDEIERNQED